MGFIHIAHAANSGVSLAITLVEKFKVVILYPLIMLMLGVAMLMFLWGIFEYIYKSNDESARSTGKRHMFWGIIGFVVMLSAVAILELALNTFGIRPDVPLQ